MRHNMPHPTNPGQFVDSPPKYQQAGPFGAGWHIAYMCKSSCTQKIAHNMCISFAPNGEQDSKAINSMPSPAASTVSPKEEQ